MPLRSKKQMLKGRKIKPRKGAFGPNRPKNRTRVVPNKKRKLAHLDAFSPRIMRLLFDVERW